MHRLLSLTFITLLVALSSGALADETQKLRALLDAEWEYTMEESPTYASELGDRRWNDKWSDGSVAARERRAQHNRELLTRLDAIDRAALPPDEQVNLDLAKYEAKLAIEEHASRLWTLPLNQMGGVQTADDLADSLRFETVKDYDDWIGRLRGVPALIDQTIELMKLGIAEKRTHPKVILRAVPGQIGQQIVEKPEESPFFKPFKKFAPTIASAERDRLAAAASQAITEQVVPAYRKLREFFEKEYLPACTDAVGAWQWPNGDATYALCARRSTTTTLSPRELHELGLREVERIGREMQGIMDQVGWKGTREQFFEHLRTAPEFFCKTGDELLSAYRATAKRIDPTLVKLFKTLPRTPYGVEPIPANVAASSPTAYYRGPAADGSRAGTFFANLHRPEIRPKHEIMALCLHEAVPGHHLQIALAQELAQLPNFRRYGGYTAYAEGWGLYAESLGNELGLYDDAYSKFGQLTFEAWRACRLVVDTGMHAMKWTRQQAIDYLTTHSAKTPFDAEVEIDRYIAWPGQALAYKVGELKIKELRAEATRALGEKWDVREFHDIVLSSGAVPLEVLEQNVHAWISKRTGSLSRVP
ncbi:DUF885 domain-containing protein [Verrucomicrobiota bacterium sgz303538]